MSNLINKSNHPVEVKKIQVRMWTLRDEVEAAISKRFEEEGHTDGGSVFIDDIKEFYHNIVGGLNYVKSIEDEDDDNEEEDSNLDSSGNPLDEDALAMMAAISGGDTEDEDKDKNEEAESEEAEDSSNDESDGETNEDDEETDSPEDDAAAAAAAAMLADQGLDTPEPEEDDAASAAAAAMLADQGLAPEDDDEAANAAAAAMLADQGLSVESAEDEVKREPFKRVRPDKARLIDGFIMLSDIQMDQALVFSQKGFIHGQNIVIEFLVTNKFSISASVKVVTNIARNSKIISQSRPHYRIQGLLLFLFPEEREQLRKFLKQIEPDIPVQPKKIKRNDDEDEDDDDFDDLGF